MAYRMVYLRTHTYEYDSDGLDALTQTHDMEYARKSLLALNSLAKRHILLKR